eukprot:TRINITY_DN5218_c0_g1_i1.p1 TRINITY_DN5218_c0_g1~~TRINITY_DN5218_c0_g1_i1.p1  ORF type:complete len:102 (-),score=7.99 TRINITY_DN5218_c0_g1_i1:67-372(-)
MCIRDSSRPVSPTETIDCELCNFIVTEVRYYLNQNETVSDIVSFIDETCTLSIFKANEKVCEAIVSFGVMELVKFIETSETPHVVCNEQLALCHNATLTSF